MVITLIAPGVVLFPSKKPVMGWNKRHVKWNTCLMRRLWYVCCHVIELEHQLSSNPLKCSRIWMATGKMATATLQNLLEILPREVDIIIFTLIILSLRLKPGTRIGIGFSTSAYKREGRASTNLWPSNTLPRPRLLKFLIHTIMNKTLLIPVAYMWWTFHTATLSFISDVRFPSNYTGPGPPHGLPNRNKAEVARHTSHVLNLNPLCKWDRPLRWS